MFEKKHKKTSILTNQLFLLKQFTNLLAFIMGGILGLTDMVDDFYPILSEILTDNSEISFFMYTIKGIITGAIALMVKVFGEIAIHKYHKKQ